MQSNKRLRIRQQVYPFFSFLFLLFPSVLSIALFAVPECQAKLRIVTTTEDLATIAREIGGDLANVEAIAKGYQDPHFVEPKPSYLLKLKKADLFVQVGLELEVAWAPTLLTSARNPAILPGSPGFLDASEGCEILQKLVGQPDRSMGDVHPYGNPHYWLDPGNGRAIARNIEEKLSALDSAHAQDFQKNLDRFEARLTEEEKKWDDMAVSLKGLKVVSYHNSWPNFAERFGLEVVNFVEPKPGVPPSPAHVRALIDQMRSLKISLVLVEPYFDPKMPEHVAKKAGARVVTLSPSVGGEDGILDYFSLFTVNLGKLLEALK